MIRRPKTQKSKIVALARSRLWLLLLALLPAAPSRAAQTAVVRGAPSAHASPSLDAPLTGTLPAGATVTLEQCSGDSLAGAALAGRKLPPLPPGEDDWCLVRGVGWVEAGSLVDITPDPADLLPGMDMLDPLKDPTPAWDDLSDPDE